MKHINLKSIFATFLLLMGVCQASWGYDWFEGKTLYFDNSKTNWSEVYLIIGHGIYSRAYKMEPRNNSTLYQYTMTPKWGGYDCFFISPTIGNSSLDGNATNISAAANSCPNRTANITKAVTEDILIEVSGTTTPYDINTTENYDPNGGTTIKTCHLLYENTDKGQYTSSMTTMKSMTYDETKQAYYIDITTTTSYFCFRFQRENENAIYAANWNPYPYGTKISTNGDKVAANQDISSWGEKSVCYYQGRAGDNIRIWFDYSNKQTWIAQTSVTTFTVTFNANGCDNAKNMPEAQTIGKGLSAAQPTDQPSATGYTFGGWYTDAECTIAYDFATAVTKDITLYAKWTANTTTTNVVYFVNKDKKPGTIYAYAYTENNGKIENAVWPGVAMIKEAYQLRGADVWKYESPTQEYQMVIFNNSWQTDNLTWTNGKYYYDGEWYTRAELEAEPAQEIYVQGRFRVRKTKEGDEWNFTGTSHGDWNNNSNNIKFEYDADKKLYKLNTYCSVEELSDGHNQNPYFYFKIGGTTYGAETDGMAPSLSSSKNKITAGTHSFQFSDACEGGYNVVLYIDWENKQFWYEKEGTVVSTPYYGLDGFGGDWINSKLLQPNDDGIQATCTLTFNSRGPQSFGIRQWKSSIDSGQKAWWWCASGTTIRRNNCTGIKFKKEGEYAGQNPTLVVDAIGDYVFTYTYADSTLTVTYPEKVITPQKYKLYGDFYDTGWKEYEGTWTTDLKEGKWTLGNIPEGAHMFMLKAADGDLYFNAGADAATIQRENTSVRVDNEYSSDNRENITLNADEAGTYIFTLDFDNKLITVTYPGNIKIKYRLVYAEQKPNGDYEKYHPSTPYINAVAEDATDERRDTVSLHIRCSIPDYHRNSLNQIDGINKYDPNPNNIYVYLQKWNGTNWEETETMTLQENERIARESGVYNFVVVQDPQASENKVYIDPNIEPYKGNYYIRTNVAPGRWNNYKKTGNQITYSDYAAQHKHFEYYWCKWVDMGKTEENLIRDGMANLKFAIANDYSNCVSDTCLDELDNRKFTVNGRLGSNANVRWMWHSKTNDIDRAYVAGKDANLFLVNKGGTINGAETGTFSFEDRENWTYKIELTATPNTKFAITKKPHDGAGDQHYWMVGNETEGVTLIKGEGRDTYRMRIVYDFKSDHLIYAWVPEDETKISESIDLGAAVVCMRKDNGNATQVRITPETTTLSNVQEALGVLSLSKKEFFDKPAGWNTWEREYYWISFPFDVNVSDIFSTFVWDRDYIIQEYDGASRADKGCWADSPSYWRSLSKTDKMEAGKGYVLYISHDAVRENHVYGNNPTELNIYFPSTGVTEITGEQPAIEVPSHTCEITRNNRDIYDSNWNLIGVPTWVNIEGMNNGPDPEQPENTNVSNIIINDGKTVGFYYHFNTGTEDGKPGNTWTPRNVKEGEEQLVFKNMRSYLIQWAGIIKWTNKSWEEPSAQGLQARRAAEAKDEQYTLRLELQRGEAALDQTFVRLQEDGDVTADYDMNYDMTKIVNPGANLYSLIGGKRIQAGANVLPLPAENTTVYVPVGVMADKDGMYRFSMPDGTEGMLVSIADHETGMTYNLATGDYEVPLTAGTYEQRFVLEIQPKKNVTTGCNESTADENTLRKVLIDGNLYIQRGDALYNISGAHL